MLFLLFPILLASASLAADNAVVQTSLGELIGSVLLSRNGRQYYSFTRVPFAKPPLGKLRFKDPVPADPWNGTLNASSPSTAICYQSMGKTLGSEDCLYLNIYTPKLDASLPVMVYFHGGGWRVGFTGPAISSRFFMDEDVVLVVPSYRLGPFGFLSTEDERIPGNMGLKDMALALEWTKREIKSFGGNPDLMTAFGLSAGSVSVHYLCSVPRTKGLLKGCICESGVGGAFWSLFKPGLAKSSANKVANAVGCSGDGLLECLQAKPAEEVLKTEHLLRFWMDEPLIIYGPVLEGKRDGALISEWPSDTNFPWITGITSAEGYLKVGSILTNRENKSVEQIAEEFEANKEEYLIKMLHLEDSQRDIAMKVYNRYFQNSSFIDGMKELFGEVYFVYPVLKEIKNHKGPKYFYIFDYTDGPSMWELFTQKKFNFTSGAGHGDEYYYFFDTQFMPSSPKPEPKHTQLSENLIKLWVNFAIHQNPGSSEWQQFGEKGHYLLIGNSRLSSETYNSEKLNEILNFWNSVY